MKLLLVWNFKDIFYVLRSFLQYLFVYYYYLVIITTLKQVIFIKLTRFLYNLVEKIIIITLCN